MIKSILTKTSKLSQKINRIFASLSQTVDMPMLYLWMPDAEKLTKYNDNHEPAGSPDGGQFAPANVDALKPPPLLVIV